jgi:hypothetical protein
MPAAAGNGGAARYPWPAGAATGVGSMPGTDPAEALAVVLGELPDFPYLPELPARGPGADLTGRTAALLADLPAETTPRGWRLAARPGRDLRHAKDLLAADLDALQEAADGYLGPLKVQACGPWTLAATLELPRSQDSALADPGAVADLTASLAEGLAAHVAEVRARVPGASPVVQLDEPALPGVLAGAIATASGLRRIPAADQALVRDRLAAVLSTAGAFTVVHCCAAGPPFWLIKDAGAGAVSFDVSLLRSEEHDILAETAESGLAILAGTVNPGTERGHCGGPPAPREAAAAVAGLWRGLGLAPGRMAGQVVITPACGLPGLTMQAARGVLAACREAGRIVPELIEEGAG